MAGNRISSVSENSVAAGAVEAKEAEEVAGRWVRGASRAAKVVSAYYWWGESRATTGLGVGVGILLNIYAKGVRG